MLRKLTVGRYPEKHVLVTGCDTGFGNLLVKQLDVLGFKVFACCLNNTGVENLKSECSANVTAVQMDVSSDESIAQAMEIVRSKIPGDKGLWAVVNNAGVIGDVGPTAWHLRQDYDQLMAVNLYGVIMVTKACIPLVEKAKGRIINTASIMGRFAFAAPAYCVSKYGVEAFSDVLRRENLSRNSDVSVHIIEPGFYRTPLVNEVGYRRKIEAKIEQLPSDIRVSLPSNIVDTLTEQLYRFVNKVASSKVSDVVDAYVDAIVTKFPKKRYLVGFDANFIFRPLWMLPEWISDRVIVRMLKN